MTIETAIENYKKEKKVITDKINEYKSKLAEQKELQKKKQIELKKFLLEMK